MSRFPVLTIANHSVGLGTFSCVGIAAYALFAAYALLNFNQGRSGWL